MDSDQHLVVALEAAMVVQLQALYLVKAAASVEVA